MMNASLFSSFPKAMMTRILTMRPAMIQMDSIRANSSDTFSLQHIWSLCRKFSMEVDEWGSDEGEFQMKLKYYWEDEANRKTINSIEERPLIRETGYIWRIYHDIDMVWPQHDEVIDDAAMVQGDVSASSTTEREKKRRPKFPKKLKTPSTGSSIGGKLKTTSSQASVAPPPTSTKRVRSTPSVMQVKKPITFGESNVQTLDSVNSEILTKSPTGEWNVDKEEAVLTSPRTEVVKTEIGPYSSTEKELANLDSRMRYAVELFKKKPKEGVKYLINENIVKEDAADIAKILYNLKVWDKKQLGEYLGTNPEEDPLIGKILGEYVALIEFKNVDFDCALRKFLYTFQLPGEGQKIDRFMKKFAHEYYKVNHKEHFVNETAVYNMAFSVIMLNTDAHNDNVRWKMSKQQFIRNNEGINGGQDLPIDFQEDIYFRIVNDEIKLRREEARFPDCVRQGWLHVLGGKSGKTWKRRWGILDGVVLYLYKKIEYTSPPLDKISLLNMVLTPLCRYKGRAFCLRMTPRQQEAGNESAAQPTVILSAQNGEEISLWTQVMEDQMSQFL